MARDSGLSLRCPQLAIFEAAPALREMGLLAVLRFARVLWISTRFRKIGVGRLQQRILIPVSQLALHGSVVACIPLLPFHSTFRAVLIFRYRHKNPPSRQ